VLSGFKQHTGREAKASHSRHSVDDDHKTTELGFGLS